MSERNVQIRQTGHDASWRVSDDLSDLKVSAGELDTIEAFLMPLLKTLLSTEPGRQKDSKRADILSSQIAAFPD